MKCPACDHENIPGVDLCGECGLDLAGLDVAAWGVNPEDPVLAAPVSSLPLKTPLVLEPTATVEAAIDLMKSRYEGCVFVVEGAKLVGVFTERDVTVRVAAPARDPEQTLLQDVMTRNPLALHPEDALAWAMHRMGFDGYRHLPVLDGERLTGFLSMRTVLKRLLEA